MRECKFCEEAVTSSNPEVDYCRSCYYGGAVLNEQFGELISDLSPLDSYWEHTGGGCFCLCIRPTSEPERYRGKRARFMWATEDESAGPPETLDGPWWLIAYEVDEGGEWVDEEGKLVGEHLTRAELVAFAKREVESWL